MIGATPAPQRRLLLLGGALAVGGTVAALAGAPSASALEDAFAGTGALGFVAYALLYAVLVVALVPGAALTIAAGALYGPVGGTVVSLVGATLGATAAFAVARRSSRSAVEQLRGERLARVERRLRDHGLMTVVALRLVPLVPFNVFNYVAGASALRTRDYVLGTAVGIVPGAIAFATLGGSIGDPGSPAFVGAVALIVVMTAAGALAARRSPPEPAGPRQAVEPERDHPDGPGESVAPEPGHPDGPGESVAPEPAHPDGGRESVAPELRRLAWAAAFVVAVAAILLSSGLYH